MESGSSRLTVWQLMKGATNTATTPSDKKDNLSALTKIEEAPETLHTETSLEATGRVPRTTGDFI